MYLHNKIFEEKDEYLGWERELSNTIKADRKLLRTREKNEIKKRHRLLGT